MTDILGPEDSGRASTPGSAGPRRRLVLVGSLALVTAFCVAPSRSSASGEPTSASGEPTGASGASREPTVILSGAELGYPPFSLVDSDGRPTGFSVELLRAALGAMGRDVDFRLGPWSEVRGWLETGDVQALPLVGRTPEREARFDFTFPYMSLHGAIVVRKGDTAIRDLHDLRGKQVAVMRGDNAEEFLRREDRGIEIHASASFEEALRELSAGRHDAVVVQRLVALRLIQETGLQNLRIIGRPIEGFRQDFCFAVRSGDHETLALLNEGLALVTADGTRRRLHARWFAALELPVGRRIVVGGDHDYPPFEYLDEDGRPAGHNVDLTRAIAHALGLEVEIRLGPWTEILRGLEEGDIDVLQGLSYSPDRDRSFDFSPPHTVNHYVSVALDAEGSLPSDLEALRGKRVAVQRGDIIHDYLLKNEVEARLGVQLTALDTHADVLAEVVAGEHDLAIVNRMTALHWIRSGRSPSTTLRVGSRPFQTAEIGYAVRSGGDALLAEFSEGLRLLEESGEYRRIGDEWLGVYEDATPGLDFVVRYGPLIGGLILAVLLASLAWTWSLRRQVARQTAALRDSEARYRLLAENSLDAIWTMNLDLEFTYINPACLPMTGYTPEEYVGSRLSDYCDEENFEILARALADGMGRGPESAGTFIESVLLRKNGEPFPVEAHAKVIYGDDGRPAGVQGVTRDVTERKRVEAQLVQAQKMESVGRLAGGVAHDFNNMLGVIIGNAELAMEDAPPGSQVREDFSDILEAARRAADITRQLLAFARKQPIAPRVVDVNHSVEGMLKMLRRLIGEDIDLEWRPGPGTWPVLLDPSQLDQILANLCVNARDAIDGVGRVTIETTNEVFDMAYCTANPGALPGEYVRLLVSDDGCGMDEEVLSRVFEPFFTTKAFNEGTGLGLPMVHGIVNQNRGFVIARSQPGKGATFLLHFPRHLGAGAELQSPADGPELPLGRGETVLLVEDEPSVLKMGSAMLEKLGYRVLAASTPAQAEELAAAGAGEIRILVTDVIMPEMSGRDLADRLKARYPGLRVLFMSGYTADVIGTQGVLDAGVHFIQKPFSITDLATGIRAAS